METNVYFMAAGDKIVLKTLYSDMSGNNAKGRVVSYPF